MPQAGNFEQGVISFGSPNYLLEITRSEHDGTGNTAVKKAGLYAWDSDNLLWRRVSVDSSGQIVASDSFKIPEYDDIALNYSGTQLSSVDYKFGGSTVATLSLTYSGTQLTEVSLT